MQVEPWRSGESRLPVTPPPQQIGLVSGQPFRG